jgi:hypothetical protein
MEKLVKIIGIGNEIKSVEDSNLKLTELCKNVYDNKPKVVDRIKKFFPKINFMDCHKVRAILHDLKREGKLARYTQMTPRKRKASAAAKGSQKKKGRKEDAKGEEKEEVITPDKVSKPSNYYAGVESLRGKKRKSITSFKRREALSKKVWKKDDKQMSIDNFLVPKRKKKTESNQLIMMGCSDSFS